jgi:small subunit ribosomal protein S3Ae
MGKQQPQKKSKKKVADAFEKKVWFNVTAPAPFKSRDIGFTPVNKTQASFISSEAVKGRVVEVNLAELQKEESFAHQKIKLRIEEVVGSTCLTSFAGLSFTTDKVCSLIRKWQTLIEANVDLKTTDGYILRLFCLGFTDRRKNQIKKTSYAKTSQVKRIRKRMFAIMRDEVTKCELKALIDKFIVNSIGEKITKACQIIYPVKDVYIRKVKVLSTPKYDVNKFNFGILKIF